MHHSSLIHLKVDLKNLHCKLHPLINPEAHRLLPRWTSIRVNTDTVLEVIVNQVKDCGLDLAMFGRTETISVSVMHSKPHDNPLESKF